MFEHQESGFSMAPLLVTGFFLLIQVGLLLIAYRTEANTDESPAAPDSSAGNVEPAIAALRRECQDLRDELAAQNVRATQTFRQETFARLESLLTQYRSVRQMAIARPDLPAKNLTALFTSLDNLLQSWGYEAIGTVWEPVAFDPQLHQPDVPDLQPGELVYVRFVGYQTPEGNILSPAKVSRTLPVSKPN